MAPPDHATEENCRLRRTMRDLVALSTLPAGWVGLRPDGIARSLADALLHTLALDLVYVRLAGLTGEGGVEVVRGTHGPDAAQVESVKAALAPLLESEPTGSHAMIPAPSGEGMLNVAVIRFGDGDVRGVLVAGSRNADFPTEEDRLLLGVGANQIAIVVQRRRAEGPMQEQREWLRVTLASIGDAVIATDTEGRVTFLNDVARELTGWNTPGDAEGKPLEAVFVILDEETRRPVENPVERVLREGVVVGLGNHTVLVARDGAERPIDDSAAPIRDAAGEIIGVVLIFRDVTQQRRAEQQRNARLAVTHTLGEAATVEEGTGGVLRAVCENLGWDLGLYWTVDERGEALGCRGSWHRPDARMSGFEKASCDRTIERGEGLPGRVWASGRPAWIVDIARDSNFPRRAPAVECGLHSAFACPVAVGGRTLGVIEFFTRRPQEPDTGLLEMMGTVAGGVGQFLERKAFEDELRRSEQELADFFDNATVGLHCVGPDGIILRANQAELDMLGYGREEYVGRPIADFHADRDVIRDILRRLNSGEKLAEYPARLRCKDGSIKDVVIDSSVLWRDGRFVHTRCFTRDVTERKRAEEDQARLAAIIESSDDAIVSKTLDGVIRSWNAGAERLFGYTAEEAVGRPITLIIPPERLDEERAILDRLRRGERIDHFETVRVSKGGRRIDIALTVSPVRDGKGRIIGASKVARDITEQKRTEQERRLLQEEVEAERARLEEVFRRAPSFLAIVRGPEHVFELANDRFYQLIGDREILGKPVREALPELAGQGFSELLDRVYRSGEAFAGADMRVLVRRHPGQPLEERFLEFVYQPLRGPDGSVSGILAQGIDLTERKRAEEAVRERDERLRLFLENATDYAFIITDPEGLALAWEGGAERITGWRADEVIGKPASVLFTAEERAAGVPEAEMAEAARSGRADDRRWHVKQDGSWFFADGVMVSLRGPGGELRGFGKVIRDATEQERAEEALRQADRRKDEFIALLAHELRNPLAPLRNGLEVMRLARGDAVAVAQARSMMERQLGHMVRLVDDLLDVSRISQDKMELRRSRVALTDVVNSAVETARPAIEEAGHELTVSLPAEPVFLDADLTRLAQVLGNLLSNSAKYTERGGRIWLGAERRGGEVIVSVRDTGIGIPPDALPRIFDMFSQVDRSVERSTGGLGIGLALVKGLVEMHGGTVTAESAGQGLGSTFTVRLPVPERVHQPVREGPAEGGRPAGVPGRRILVVDDNEDSALSMAGLLALMGNEARAAHDGLEAIEAAEEFRPEVILMDVGMPRLNGYEAARRIRGRPWGRSVVIIALTGWGQEGDRLLSSEAGCDGHLVKPVDPDDLVKLLADLEAGNGRGPAAHQARRDPQDADRRNR